MLNKDDQKLFRKTFEETFGYLLNEFEDYQENLEGEDDQKNRKESPLNIDKQKRSEFSRTDDSKSTTGKQSKGLGSKQVLTPLSNEREARAISIGLQEIQKMKEYVFYTYNHQSSEFNRIYASYPLLFGKKFDKVYAEAHQKITDMVINSEHFISGNFHNIEAIKNNLRLIQPLKEKRLTILYNILAFYDNKNNFKS